MTSLISVILVIMMAFTSVGGMNAELEEPVSFDAKISMDVKTVMALGGAATTTEETAQQAKMIEDILDAVTLKGVADKESSELQLYAGEDLIMSAGVKKVEGGAKLASSLLGSKVIYCSDEMLQTAQQQMMQSSVQAPSGVDVQGMMDKLQNMDWEQISKDVGEVMEKVSQTFQEKIGEPETGEYTVDDMAFTVKIPVNITYAELTETLLNAAKELAGKESIKPLLETLAQGKDVAAEIDKALENLKNQSESQQYDLAIASYSDAEGASYTVIDASRPASEDGTVKAESLHLGIGMVKNQTKILVTSEQFNFDLTSGIAEDGSSAMQMNLSGQGIKAAVTVTAGTDGTTDTLVSATIQNMPLKLHIVTAPAGDRMNYEAEVSMMGRTLLTVKGSAGKGGQLVSVYEGEGLEELPIDKLSDETVNAQVSMVALSSVLNGLVTLRKNVPEDTAQMLTELIKQMMNPGGVDLPKTTNP